MDRILYGDNQFFGVNHMSEEKARAQTMRFPDTASIMKVLDSAYEMGLKTFMCTTHDQIAEICEIVRRNPGRYSDLEFYPGMPYAHKYANAVTEDGVFGALRRFAGGNLLSTLAQGGAAVAAGDVVKMMKLLVDAEMRMFVGLSTKVVFLQNVVVDLLLGLRMKRVFVEYAAYIRKRYNAEPGFITMNLPALLDLLDECGISNPVVCASINKIGFRMCGGVALYEKVLEEREFRPIAMSIFASGAIPPQEAIEYVCSLRGVESIVFGASSVEHIAHTRDLITRYTA